MDKLLVQKRTGEVVDFDEGRIRNAILKAINATNQQLPQDVVDDLVSAITQEIAIRFVDFYPNVENIQDIVEKHIVKRGMYEIAKTYILYRAKRQKEREEEKKKDIEKLLLGKLTVKKKDGRTVLFDINKVRRSIARAAYNYETDVSIDLIAKEAIKNLYDGILTEDIEKALILASVSFIEKDPAYSFVSARLFMQRLYKEVIGLSVKGSALDSFYRESFISGIKKGSRAD